MAREQARELGRPSLALVDDSPGAAGAYNRPNGKSHRASTASDGVVVPTMAWTTQPGRREGPRLYHMLVMEGEIGECLLG
jgi:hypothetical protein